MRLLRRGEDARRWDEDALALGLNGVLVCRIVRLLSALSVTSSSSIRRWLRGIRWADRVRRLGVLV